MPRVIPSMVALCSGIDLEWFAWNVHRENATRKLVREFAVLLGHCRCSRRSEMERISGMMPPVSLGGDRTGMRRGSRSFS